MRRTFAALLVGAMVGASLWCGGVVTAEDKPQAASTEDVHPKLAALSWLAGHWVTKRFDDQLEEIWSAPKGDSMMGMFRWIKGGKASIYELCTITVEDDDLIFRIRHFHGPKLDAWEDKEAALTLKATNLEPNVVAFQTSKIDMPRIYGFEKTDTGITVRIEGLREGKPVGDEFKFRPAKK